MVARMKQKGPASLSRLSFNMFDGVNITFMPGAWEAAYQRYSVLAAIPTLELVITAVFEPLKAVALALELGSEPPKDMGL